MSKKKKNSHILKLETDVLWYWNNTDRLLCGFLRPKFGVASGLHLTSTTGAYVVIPEVYAVGTAMEAESAYKRVEAGGGISYDAAYDKGDYVVAVGAGHGEFFRKPTSPPLPLREGPPLISVFSPQGRRGNRSSSSLVTISFYGWRTIRGLRQQRSCGFLCGDEPAFTQGLGCWLLAQYWVLARCLMSAHSMISCWGLVIAAKGYLESFSVNMFLRKRVLPRM